MDLGDVTSENLRISNIIEGERNYLNHLRVKKWNCAG
jgi:hypothetical protein